MTLQIRTASGVAVLPDRFREYTNPYNCRMVFSEDCFDHRFSLSGLSRHYEDLWSEVAVVYQNVLGETEVPPSDCVVHRPISAKSVLQQVLKLVVDSISDETSNPDLRDGDTAFLYGKRYKLGRGLPELGVGFPVLNLPGDWELLCVAPRFHLNENEALGYR
jgi:hypothetical protein